jgi:hypothetical protein
MLLRASGQPYSKRVSLSSIASNNRFNTFKNGVSDVIAAEKGIAILGRIGVLDNLISLYRQGKLVSLAGIRSVLGSLGKSIPIAGTAAAVYSWVTALNRTRTAYSNL